MRLLIDADERYEGWRLQTEADGFFRLICLRCEAVYGWGSRPAGSELAERVAEHTCD